MIVVSDTSPIRALAHLGLLELLGRLYDKVIIPPAVVRELEAPIPTFTPVRVQLLPYVEVRSPAASPLLNELHGELDHGEAEAIALAAEINSIILIDEKTVARKQ